MPVHRIQIMVEEYRNVFIEADSVDDAIAIIESDEFSPDEHASEWCDYGDITVCE